MTEAEEREAFEKWARLENMQIDRMPSRYAAYGSYDWPNTEQAWKGWRARALSPTAPQPDPTEAQKLVEGIIEMYGIDGDNAAALRAALGETSVGEQTSGAKGNV